MTRAFQQFSRFRLGKELGQTQHHFLKQDKVGQSGNILEPLALELSEPRERFGQTEETVRNVQTVLRLTARTRDVQRPRAADAGLTGLDELGEADVDDSLTAGLGAADAEQAVDLLAEALTCGPRELVAKQRIPVCYSPLTQSGGLPRFRVALHLCH